MVDSGRSHPGGRVVLVTGGASGIGRGMALGLLSRGYRVVALDRDPAGLQTLSEEAGAGSAATLATLTVDLTRFDADEVVAQAAKPFGPVDILVNNAGVGMGLVRADYHRRPVKFYDVTPDIWNTAMAVNATAVFLLSRCLVPAMLGRGWGRVINVTTSLGTMLRGGYVPYGTTKSSTEALSAQMSQDVEGTGVTVNVITPGAIVNTALIPSEAPYARQELVQPDVMLAPLYWLCSSASDAVNGRRFLGVKWDAALPPEDAATAAGAPIGWRDLAALPKVPGGKLY